MEIRVGTVLYGYCNGFFGRDSYGDKRVESIGADWVVVREENGMPDFAYFAGRWKSKMQELLNEWASEPQVDT